MTRRNKFLVLDMSDIHLDEIWSSNLIFINFELEGFSFYLTLELKEGGWLPVSVIHRQEALTQNGCPHCGRKRPVYFQQCLWFDKETLNELQDFLLNHPSIRLRAMTERGIHTTERED